MQPVDDDDLSQQIQSAAKYEQEFWLALRIALASPETLKQEFHGLALWMLKSIDASARLGVENTFVDSYFRDAFLGYGDGHSNYTSICEIVRHYNARQSYEQGASEVLSSVVSGSGVGIPRPPQPNYSAAALVKSVTDPPLLRMATKPPPTLSRVTASEKVASTAGVSPTYGSVHPQAPIPDSMHPQRPMLSGTTVDRVASTAGAAPTNASMHSQALAYDSTPPQHPMLFRTAIDKLPSTAGIAPTYDSIYPQTLAYESVHPQHPILPRTTTDEVASTTSFPSTNNPVSHHYPTLHRTATSDKAASTAGAAPTSGPVERVTLTVGAASKCGQMNPQHSIPPCMTASEKVASTAGADPTVSTTQIPPSSQDGLDKPFTEVVPSAGREHKTWQKLGQGYPYERRRAGSIDRQRLQEEWRDPKEDFGMPGSAQDQMQQLVMDWAMRFGQDQNSNRGSLISERNPGHRSVANSTNPDDTERHPAIKAGTPDLFLHGEPPIQKADLKGDAQAASHPDEQSGDHDTCASEGCNDAVVSPTDAADKSKRSTGSGQSKRVKVPPPPHEQRQYYPQPCPRCRELNLPCFLPIVRRATRRTCWHCSDARLKCRYTTNTLIPPAHSRNTLADRAEATGDGKAGPAKRDEDITLGDAVSDREENEASDIILHTAKLRDGILQLRDDVATLMQCFNRQEQVLIDLTRTCVKNEGILLDHLAKALGNIVESAVEVAMSRRFLRQVTNYEGAPFQEGNGGLNDAMANICSRPRKDGSATSNFGDLAALGESAKGGNISMSAGSTSAHLVASPMSQLEEQNGYNVSPLSIETAGGVFHSPQDHEVRHMPVKDEQDGVKDDDNDPGYEAATECLPARLEDQLVVHTGMEVEMSAADNFELASAPRQDFQSSAEVSNSHNNDNQPLDTSLYIRALSPLSDIPEEEEPSEKGEDESCRRAPSRSTRQSGKRKTSSGVAGHLSTAKKSRSSSKCHTPKRKASKPTQR